MNLKFYTLLVLMIFLGKSVTAQSPVRTITDSDLVGGQSYTWSSDTIYLLDGFVFLEADGILTIEAGTIIKGLQSPSTNDLASSLIITRGAQIFAEGTRNNPIIFTAEIDDTEDDTDMFVDDRGLWGGLIILGNATITNSVSEIIVEGLPADDTRSLYGGSNDGDNSGVLKYISIRHGGAELAPGEEINGLTMGGVGAGTSVSFIEVLANLDDGIEFFGGTVDLKYATVAFCGDDAIDWDTGWRGRGQFWSVLQGSDSADNGAEMDGAKPDANTPSSNPEVYNVTYIGSGQGASAKNEHALYFRDGTRGQYHNSIFTDFTNYAIQVEDRASGVDSRQYMEAGELVIANNLWFGFGEGNELNAGGNGIIQATDDAEDATAQFLIDHLAANGNQIVDPQLGGISRIEDGGYDPRPAASGPAYTTAGTGYAESDFFTPVSFKGAFCATGSWLTGWTALSEYGVLAADIDYADFTTAFACDLATDIETVVKVEDDFKLYQNVPNPVTDITVITFELPTTTTVSLDVYDINGRLIAQLISSEKRSTGRHSVEFNATNIEDGIYLYRLSTEHTILTKPFVVNR
ncbi:MAG: T9SS type A sorting domain-containing protein [Saprospiraceae bacterium]|nr:T9SS type A sorting domain-containing protein [Saprospiraceae bacterium]